MSSNWKSRGLAVVAMLIFTLMLQPGAILGHQMAQAQAGLIRLVQVNQGLGNVTKYVAGKDTAILVFLNQATAVDEAQQSVVVKLGDTTVTTLKPKPSTEPVQTLEFLCPSRPQCGEWRAGNYTFEATVNGSTAQATGTFQDRKPVRIKAVPIKANYSGDIRSTTERWRTLGEFARQVYPVAPDNFTWDLGAEVDASAEQYNLTNADKNQADQSESAVLALIAGQHTEQCRERPRNPNAQGCYDIIIGFVKDRIGADGTTQGIAIPGSGSNVSVESDQDAGGTVAHEVGHEYLLGDEYTGGSYRCDNNPPPPTYEGTDWITNQKNFKCSASTSKDFPNGSGSLIDPATDFPYEITPSGGRAQARGLLPNMMSFMGSGAQQDATWISVPAWNRIFDALAPTAAAANYQTTMSSAFAINAQADEQRWIFAEGIIDDNDNVTLFPWTSYDDVQEYENSTGDTYTLRAVDASGNTLASTALDVDLNILDSGDAERGYFEADMPFPDNTAVFQIVKGSKVLAERKASPNAPTVRITAPVAKETVSADTYTIKWEASDPDGDKLTYDVEYSVGNDDWEVIAVDLTETQLEANFAELAGSLEPDVQIRVWASDGVNTELAESGLFSVPPKAPEVVITGPGTNSTFSAGSLVTLTGLGYDPQDDDITESKKLTWTSDLQGELGNGRILNLTNLKVGTHTITLKATNSFNITGSATIKVTINQAGSPPSQPTTSTSSTPVPGSTGVATAVPTASGGATGGAPTAIAVATPNGGVGMPRTGSGDAFPDALWPVVLVALVALICGLIVVKSHRRNEGTSMR